MAFKKNDFVEIDFIAKTTQGEVFDSTIRSELEKIGSKMEAKPFVFSFGNGMFLKSVEDFLIDKNLGKHEVTLQPEDAFGNRETSLIRLIPESIFREHKVRPVAGYVFNFDGKLAKILSVNGGRVRVDFNNPLAGKVVIYEVELKRIVEDLNEKVRALNEFFFRKEFKFEVKENKLILEVPKEMEKFVLLFKDKYKEILNLDLEIKLIAKE